MGDLRGLEDDWWFLIEDDPIEPDTPLWTFADGKVTVKDGTGEPGFYRLDGEVLHIEVPSASSVNGPKMLDLVTGGSASTAEAFDESTDLLAGNLFQLVDGIGRSAGCALVRDGPWLEQEKASAAADLANE